MKLNLPVAMAVATAISALTLTSNANALEIHPHVITSPAGEPLRILVPVKYFADGKLKGDLKTPHDPALFNYALRTTDTGAVVEITTTEVINEPFKICLDLDDGMQTGRRVMLIEPKQTPTPIRITKAQEGELDKLEVTGDTEQRTVVQSIPSTTGRHVVVKGECLASIAMANRKTMGGNQNQRILALAMANGDRFTNGDPNIIEIGMILNVPDRAVTEKIKVSRDVWEKIIVAR